MPAALDLPAGLTERPLVPSDAAAVAAVMAAQQLADTGEASIEEADIVADWQRPGYVVPDHTVGVFAGDDLVGYAEVAQADRGDACVHPDHLGRGVGTQLARWMQARARELGSSVIGMPVPQGSPGDHLLEALGYHVRWTSWVLALPAGAAIPERPLPEGYAVRAATPGEYRDCHAVKEDAFLEWSERERESYSDFEAEVLRRPGFEPWHLRVVTDDTGEVAAVAMLQMSPACAFVSRIATRKEQRGRGLAQALLADTFAEAVAHGAERCELSTDSRTGALGLYEKVGMQVTSSWVNRAIAL